MNRNWKKMLPAFATSLVAITSCVNAVDDMQMRNLENRVTSLEQRRGTGGGMINPPARPVVKDGTDLWLQADALFMHATEDGLDFAIKNEANTTTFVNGHIKNIDYDWSWGFRVGAGYNMPHDGWDLLLNWTWFQSSNHKHSTANNGEFFFGTKEYPSGANANFRATHAKAHLRLHMNLFDLEMGREFFVSKWLTFRPHLGGRGGWFCRHTSMEYTGGTSLSSNELEDKLKNRFGGGGVRGGFNTQWGLGSGWSFFGDMAFSLLYGGQRAVYKQYLKSGVSTVTPQADAHSSWTNVRGMTDLGLGLRWDHLFYDDRYRVRLQLAWEQHLLLNFHQDLVFSDDTTRGTFVNNAGDFALSGVSFQTRFDF